MRFAATLVALVAVAAPAAAQVTRLEITSREVTGGYERLKGLAHGEVDPGDRRNRIIQDLELAPRNARGRVEYVATFALIKPADPGKASGVLMYSVVNRGNGAPVESPEGHISLVSGWQGDVIPTENNQTVRVPVARNRDGSRCHRSGPGPVRRPACRLDDRLDPARLDGQRSVSACDPRHVEGHADVSRRRNGHGRAPRHGHRVAGRLGVCRLSIESRFPASRIRHASA